MKKNNLLIGLLAVLLPLLTFLIGVDVGSTQNVYTSQRGGSDEAITLDRSLINEVLLDIQRYYYRPEAIDAGDMSFGAAYGIVESLGDVNSMFMPPDEASDFQDSIQGSLEGIGAELNLVHDRIEVFSVIRETPAHKAGLESGDVILKIDDVDTAGMSLRDAVSIIRGPKGTTVTLQVIHKDATEVTEISIVRDAIQAPSIHWEMKDGDIAVITLSVFYGTTSDELIKTAQEVLAAGAKGIVLDMRHNPGGVMDEGIKVAAIFLDDGPIVIARGRENEKRYDIEFGQIIMTTDGAKKSSMGSSRSYLKDLPLAVLVNGSSASASEIVAGAMQDRGRAKLIGEVTYGKGTVQELLPVKSGNPSGSNLKITVAEWLTPKGRSIDGVGLTPDIEVEIPEDFVYEGEDPQLNEAIKYMEGQR